LPWFPKAKSPPRKQCNKNETAAWRLQSADRIPGPIQLLVAGRCLPTIDAVLPNLSHGLAHGGPVVMIAVHKALLPRMRNRDSATTRRQLPKYKGLSSMRVSVDGTNFPSCAGVHPRPMPHRPERFDPPDRCWQKLRLIRPPRASWAAATSKDRSLFGSPRAAPHRLGLHVKSRCDEHGAESRSSGQSSS
jgi:hypothetical protein